MALGEFVEQSKERSVNGLWKNCCKNEALASSTLSTILEPFGEAFEKCYEAGVQAGSFDCKRSNAEDIKIAASFLKRSLTDFRAVWVLISSGYTCQAASVAAALYEHSLVVVALAGNPENERQLRQGSGDVPWSPRQLAKIAVNTEKKEAEGAGKLKDESYYEHRMKEIYFYYKYLCKMKHPTLPSAWHHCLGSKVEEHSYVLMAYPDVRYEDLSLKSVVLMGAINCLHRAIKSFVAHLDIVSSIEEFVPFSQNLNSAMDGAIDAFEILGRGPLPYGLDDF